MSPRQLWMWASVPLTRHGRCPNTEAGIADLVGQLRDVEPSLVVLEATGGFEVLLVSAMAEAGLPVVLINPPPGKGLRPSHR